MSPCATKTRVLIVDDSAVMRKILGQILGEDPDIEVVGMAADPLIAREMIKSRIPDVITLDIEMPRLDGLEFLERLMRLRPMPVVMVSSLAQDGADQTLQALALGAVDVVAKPVLGVEGGLRTFKDEIIAKVKSAVHATVRVCPPAPQPPPRSAPRAPQTRMSSRVVTLGASTGGVPALAAILSNLPAASPPVLVAQHMPAGFTRTFARRLDGICAMSVVEAADGMHVVPGYVYVAPGGRHLVLIRAGSELRCRLLDSGSVNGHIPSVDVLFGSVAETAGAAAIGVLLTGMGKDGAKGLSLIRSAGGTTACQDEKSCVVYGMPRAAMAIGAAEREMPLGNIAQFIFDQAFADWSGGYRGRGIAAVPSPIAPAGRK